MKKIFAILLIIVIAGCGIFERSYDNLNYESLSDEQGDIEVLSGGQIVRTYEDAKILYSSSDTQAIWVIYRGKKIYIQGDCIITLK